MRWILGVISLVGFYPVLLIMYYSLKDAYLFKDGTCFAVHMQKEWMEEAAVKKLQGQYRQQLKRLLLLLAVVPLLTLVLPTVSIPFTIWMLWVVAVCTLPEVPLMRANQRLKAWKREKSLTAADREAFSTEEDDVWIGGIIYYNKKDKRTMVPKRIGIGTTTNLATRAGKVWDGIGLAVLLLVVPLGCIWLMLEEFTPIQLAVVDKTLVAEHLDVEYQIPLSELETVALIDEKPKWTKMMGTGMERLCKGTFRVADKGVCQLFLNPENQLFLLLETAEETYYMSARDDVGTLEIYEKIAAAGP